MSWTKQDIHIERIYPDEEFWLKNVDRVNHFFNTSILPELLGKFYSRTSQPAQHILDVQQPCSSGTSSSSLLETIDTTMVLVISYQHIVTVTDQKKERWWDMITLIVFTSGFTSSV